MEKSSTLLFIWVILLLGSLDCGYRAWTISSRPMDEFSIYSLINEMGNLVSRTATIIVGWELVFRKKQYAIFLNSLVKLDFDLKSKELKCLKHNLYNLKVSLHLNQTFIFYGRKRSEAFFKGTLEIFDPYIPDIVFLHVKFKESLENLQLLKSTKIFPVLSTLQ